MKLAWFKPTVFKAVAASALALVILRMLFPDLLFDTTSLTLFGIAAIVLLLPNLLSLLPPLKKLKYGEFEAEFDKEIKRFGQRVGEAEQAPVSQKKKLAEGHPTMLRSFSDGFPLTRTSYAEGFKSILTSGASNTEKIVSAAILCEQMLDETARLLDLTEGNQRRTSRAIVQALAKHGFISEAELQAFDEFWKIRNSVVHGQGPPPNDEQTARLLDLLWRLVRTLA